MPALKMKTKLSKTSIKETSCLHISERSCMISKKSGSHIKNAEENAEPCNAHIQHEECIQDIDRNNVIQAQQPLDDDHTNSNKQLSESVKSISTGEMEEAHPGSSNLETIFSPIVEPNDLMEKQTFNGITSNCGSPTLALEDNHDRKSLCDYQTCSISDFYISDMIIAGIPSDGASVDDGDIINSISFDDYRCDESGMLFDVADQCMLVPFLDCTLIANSEDAKSHEDDASFYLAISQMSSCNAESHSNSDSDDVESFDPHLYIKSIPELSDAVSGGQSLEVPKGIQKRKSVTLVLDLDETLVHSTLENCDDADFNFTVFFNMKEHTVYVKKRPYLHTFLERVADMFNVVIFTASQCIYAEQLLDVLDPEQKLISHRVFRDSCTFFDGTYTKDLTVLGLDLAKVAIIDNSPQVFRFQVDNGIPIKSWFDDPSDCALIALLPFLETLVDAVDVRPIISKRFGNKA